jgi:hypothetical protein
MNSPAKFNRRQEWCQLIGLPFNIEPVKFVNLKNPEASNCESWFQQLKTRNAAFQFHNVPTAIIVSYSIFPQLYGNFLMKPK